MSLNGLDSPAVTQAYQSALAEAGGWFLLRYTARDAVEVLKRGAGGAVEARAAVAQYEEKSPLYGLLLYRRRKVLLKCVPEGTSRLLQARVAVHFLAIADRFAPHDVVLSVSTPDELGDAALAAACTLHTAAPSTSSSSGSSRQQKLSWIQEAADEGTPATHDAIPTILEPPASNTDSASPLAQASQDSAPLVETVPLILEADTAAKLVPVPGKSPISGHVAADTPIAPESDLGDLQPTLQSYDQLFEGGSEQRLSSQTARPDYNELYEHYYAQYTKPKVKLGPRPRQRPSIDGTRPSTSGSASQDVARPVSSLPSGLRSATRKAAEKKESKTRSSSVIPTIAIPPLPPMPKTPDMPQSPMSCGYSMRSIASARSMPISVYSSHHRSTGMTQEKTRLMKALELRKKQQQAQQDKAEKLSQTLAVPSNSLAETPAPETVADEPLKATDSMAATTPDANEEQAHAQDEKSSKPDATASAGDDQSTAAGSDNSGLPFAAESQTEGDDLNSAASVSSPISTQTHGSSGAPSTRPSSLSDDDRTSLELSRKQEEDPDLHSPDSQDEGHSVESTPTIVPESRTPVPSMAWENQIPQTTVTDSSQAFDSHSNGLTMPNEEADDSQARRRSKRESRMYIPSGDAFQYAESPTNIKQGALSIPNPKRQSWYETKEQRRAMLDPLEFSGEHSETEYMSDDSFMEELQSATVHEAQPMSVSKAPLTPLFSQKSFTGGMNSSGTMTPPGTASSFRSIGGASSGWPPRPTTSETVVVAKKINVSSGISQRIKALAEKSSREMKQSPIGVTASSLEPGSTLAQRKSNFFAASPLEASPNAGSSMRMVGSSLLNSSTSSTPDKKQAASIKSTVYNVHGAEKAESVQVTARIIRDERTTQPTLTMPTENTPLELHQSPLIIDHQTTVGVNRSPTRGRPEPESPREPPSSHSREHSIAPSRNSSDSTWRAFGRRMSETKSINSHDGGEDKGEDKRDKKDKKDSRTSKMFKRMSSSIPWKSSSNNLGLPEHNLGSTSLFSLREPPSPVHVGDLNIQFPDTLLWKRRCVEIDASGNLVLSPSRSNEKGIIKRFHLSEFRSPYLPDQDRQELPNSVVLDFIDGRTLQCACETYIAQAQVLQTLTEAHDAWLAYNQAL